ncbi:MAG: flagellar filament capping protein FliD [SAR324 cluster bacterium]|nr:flagellar filament capping protein FliD [SAR324 cluster bacterium]
MADFNPNVVTGLGSGMDTKAIIKTMIEVEQKKIEPVKKRQEEKTLELAAWKQVKTHLETVKGTSEVLSKKSMWEGKIVSSSNPDVVDAVATAGAKPGKHTLVVDKLALNHQIASQGFEDKDVQVGTGRVTVTTGVDGENTETIVIDETNNTLQGFADAIGDREMGVSADIIKTGSKDRPYQIVLTSDKTGFEGEIKVEVALEGDDESPSFDPFYSQPGAWKGIKKQDEAAAAAAKAGPTGLGASTAIPVLGGTYQGEDPIELEFTVVNTGVVGTSESLRIRWEDNQDRQGYLDLGSFNYTPGDPIPVVDGITMAMGVGEVLVNDTFNSNAKPQESDLFWWKDEMQRAPAITQPKTWGKQATEGAPVITGELDTGEDDSFTLKVVGSGQVGAAENLQIEYTSENGLKGTAFVGSGYKPGTPLSLGHGLAIEVKPGLLNDGAFSTFAYQAGSTENLWWLDDDERNEGNLVKDITNWVQPEVDEEDDLVTTSAGGLSEQSKPKGPRVSTAAKEIVGSYDNFESKVYTFTALGNGAPGVTKNLELKWEDNMGNNGVLSIGGDEYEAGKPVAFDSGLSLVLGEGEMFESDSFTFRTFSPVIQPPQDAEVRLGATELGGGLLITNPTNTLDDVIDGVKLNLISTSEKPVTISIKGDTEKAVTTVAEFVTSYNEMLAYFRDATKYDKETDTAGPLQGDRNLPKIQSETANIFIDTVFGLSTDSNQLITVGLKLGDDGLIKVDEDKLRNATEDDLGKVANLFRSFGQVDNTGISYLSSTKDTQISGETPYAIDITSAATRGFYTTKEQMNPQPIVITEANEGIYLSVNGRESEVMKIPQGTYDMQTLSREIQKLVIDDKFLSKMKIVITEDGGQMTIRSNMTGARSSVVVRPANPSLAMTHPLAGGVNKVGDDVVGSIDGVQMDGTGQILSGPEGTKYDGLKLFISLTETQIGDEVEGHMTFTKGVGTKVTEYIEEVMDTSSGSLGVYTKNVEEQLAGYDTEIKTLEERLGAKREKLQMKFAKMESQLGQLKSEQKYLSAELSKL